MAPGRVTLRAGDREQVVEVIDDTRVSVDGVILQVAIDGRMIRVAGMGGGPAWAIGVGDVRWVYHDGCVYELEVQRAAGRRRTAATGSLAAPMPATVRQIRVRVGEGVARGDTLIVLEAMKMELPIRADADGTVAALHCREGELVQPGRPLIDLTEKAG
jgi:acetyl/propionyl-CoA carboxylase alpha subunit